LGPRAGVSTVLIAGALVLLIAIAIGNNMGNRVLGQIGSRAAGAVATPVPSPSAGDEDDGVSHVLWKRRQVLSVATDPAFPDPRVTPEPPPPPPPPTPSAPSDGSSTAPPYTSPPMPIPLVSHDAGETTAPDEGPSSSAAPPHTGPPTPTPRPAARAVSPSASPGVSTVNN
jgi:hypothetical protein